MHRKNIDLGEEICPFKGKLLTSSYDPFETIHPIPLTFVLTPSETKIQHGL